MPAHSGLSDLCLNFCHLLIQIYASVLTLWFYTGMDQQNQIPFVCIYIHSATSRIEHGNMFIYGLLDLLNTLYITCDFVHYMLISTLQNTTAQTPSIFSLYYRTKCRSFYSNIALIHRALCSYLSLNPDTMISNQIGLTYFSMFTFGHNSK